MIKTMTFAAASAFAFLAAPQAAHAEAAAPLPPTYIIHKLTQDGILLRELEADGNIYEARVEATDGSIVKVGIDPQSAELTDAYSHAKARKAEGARPHMDAAQAIQAVAATGYWDIREIEFDDGNWQVAARDDEGRGANFVVDAASGAVR